VIICCYAASPNVWAARLIDLCAGAAGDFCIATDISADGKVVAGTLGLGHTSEGRQPFLWSEPTGLIGIGRLYGGPSTTAESISADGTTVVGDGTYPGAVQAFRWTQPGGMVGLNQDLSREIPIGVARDVSGDGSVVVGYAWGGGLYAAKWDASGNLSSVGPLPHGIMQSLAQGISADGTVIVGEMRGADRSEAFRWTQSGGVVGLGDLTGDAPNDRFNSIASDVSANGSVVVGVGTANNLSRAFRWTSGGGMVTLGVLVGPEYESVATGVSADGSIVVGKSAGQAFRWRAADGMQSVVTLLQAAGVDASNWYLEAATAISADGNRIIGIGSNEFGGTRSWLADLTIPEPTSIFLALCAIAPLANHRQRRRR
jgi:probable HAF family extracellular repeat protein